jgi:hypothetical protein
MRRRLSYANVMATVAVFIALGGSSYAAIKITGKNVKDGSLTGADVKNRSLTGRDVKDKSLSPADFNGSVQGPKGDTGQRGLKGDTGEPGPFPAELPSGKTLTGVYSVSGVASAADQYFDMPISFGFRFASAPTVVTVGSNDTAEEAAAAGCPGTAADPKAAPGKFCIYEIGRENTRILDAGFLEAGGDSARVSGYAPPFSPPWGVATRFGTILEVYSAAAGNLYSNGVWAATSP